MRRLLGAAACALLACAAQAQLTDVPVRMGVLAARPKPQAMAQWQPVAAYLESALHRHVELEVFDHAELDAAAEQRRVDLVVTNPSHSILLQQTAGLSTPLVTMIAQEGTRELSAYGGVIFARSDRADISSLGDLAGKRIAAVSAESLAAYQLQALEMMEADIPLPKGDRLLFTGLPLDRVVDAVFTDRADVGFVRTGMLEAMAREGKFDLGQVRIINRQDLPGFPYVSSTRLYPEWPVAVMPQVDKDLAARLTVALLSMSHRSLGGAAAGIHGFGVPASYDGVENMLRRLRLPPYDKIPEVTAIDLWRRYGGWIVAVCALALLVLAAGAGLVVLYGRSRRGEAMVRRLNAELEQRVEQRTAQLQAANKELEDFSYSMSHDMRTPLRAIDGYSKILLDEHGQELDAEGRKLQTALRGNAQQMGRMIDDMLEFLNMRKRRIVPVALDMAALAREEFTLFDEPAPGRAMRLEVGALPPAWGDPVMIRQVLHNLLSNAVKFSSPERENVIEVGGSAGPGENTYFVKDRGVGFDMRYGDKLFRVFERVHPTGQFEGTAIGLAVVKRIVERHGGRVWAEGRVGDGATFHFSLPNAAFSGVG